MKKLVLAAFLATTTLTGGATLAQETAPAVTPAEQAEGRAILETARTLVNYGESKGDALALVTAAKMFTSVPGRVLAEGEKGTAGKLFDVEAVLNVIGGFELQEVLQLQEAVVLVLEADLALLFEQDVGPLPHEALETQVGHRAFDGRAHVFAYRVERRHGAVDFGKHVRDRAVGVGLRHRASQQGRQAGGTAPRCIQTHFHPPQMQPITAHGIDAPVRAGQ